MKLGIKNFAKIKDADIIIDGITVIAGENNTGKSTVGKILFSLFNALSDIDEKIFIERLRAIERANRRTIQNYISNLNVSKKASTDITNGKPMCESLMNKTESNLLPSFRKKYI